MVCTRETLLPYVANAEILVRNPNFELKFGCPGSDLSK
jgi:hypothetical protein